MGKMINIFPALSGEPTTMSRAPSTKRDEQYLAWLEELHSRCCVSSTLDYMFQCGRPLTAETFITLNSWGEEPGEIGAEDQELIDLLRSCPSA